MRDCGARQGQGAKLRRRPCGSRARNRFARAFRRAILSSLCPWFRSFVLAS